MPAYVISDLRVTDATLAAEYRRISAESIAQYGGRYLARFGTIEPMEGGWDPAGLVIVEFPSLQRAHEWWDSPEYAKGRTIAARAIQRRVIFVDGVTTQ